MKRGFSLLEILIATATLGFLAALVIPVFQRLNEKAEEKKEQLVIQNHNCPKWWEGPPKLKVGMYQSTVDDILGKPTKTVGKSENREVVVTAQYSCGCEGKFVQITYDDFKIKDIYYIH